MIWTFDEVSNPNQFKRGTQVIQSQILLLLYSCLLDGKSLLSFHNKHLIEDTFIE